MWRNRNGSKAPTRSSFLFFVFSLLTQVCIYWEFAHRFHPMCWAHSELNINNRTKWRIYLKESFQAKCLKNSILTMIQPLWIGMTTTNRPMVKTKIIIKFQSSVCKPTSQIFNTVKRFLVQLANSRSTIAMKWWSFNAFISIVSTNTAHQFGLTGLCNVQNAVNICINNDEASRNKLL